MFTVNKNPTPADLKKFGWAMLIGFGAIGCALWYLSGSRDADTSLWSWSGSSGQTTAVVFWSLGLLLCVLGVGAPAVAKPIYVVWMSVTVPIGIVMSTIMLSVLFFVLLPVFSLIVRTGDPLRKKLKASGSYWEDYKPHEATIERMQRPF